MEPDRETLAEVPEPSWSENSTPDSEDIEEIVRQDDQPLRIPPRPLGSYSRHIRPAIRRRLNLQERVGRGGNITKTIHVAATVEMRRNTGGSDVSSASNFTIITSASSTSTSPWSTSGFVEEDEQDEQNREEQVAEEVEEQDANMDAQDEDLLLVPKLEPLDDDDVDMNDVTDSAALQTLSSSMSPVTLKRKRGRPRKHPVVNPDTVLKVAKGRSKTGCITCRRRKKKCDEGKPGCK
jgi:hypothetical protein